MVFSREVYLANLEEVVRKRRLSYDPFETEGYPSSNGQRALLEGKIHYCGLVKLYARFGLHRYNLLEGKNYEFISLKKYNYRDPLDITTSYYITVVGKNRDDGSLQEFHTKVDEQMRCILMLTCYISRTRDDPYKVTPRETFDLKSVTLPKWPKENPFEDTELYYMLTKSQLEDKVNDWIRVYLELAVAASDSRSKDHDLSHLKIKEVATNHEDLSSTNSTFYIRYEDRDNSRVGKDVFRVAIVQRNFDKKKKCFSLSGLTMSAGVISLHRRVYPKDSTYSSSESEVIQPPTKVVKKSRKNEKDGNVTAITQGEQHKTLAKNKRGRKRKRVLEFDTATKRERPAGYP